MDPTLLALLASGMLVAAFLYASVGHGGASAYIAAMVIGGVLGVLSGLTGVGGGIFLSPLLLLFGWAGTKQTSAVAAPFILVNSLAALAAGFVRNPVPPPDYAWWLMAAVLVGGWAGAEYGSRRFANPLIRQLLAAVLAIAGAQMVLVEIPAPYGKPMSNYYETAPLKQIRRN